MEGIIVKIDTTNLDMSSKKAMQVISDIGQAMSLVQAENHLD